MSETIKVKPGTVLNSLSRIELIRLIQQQESIIDPQAAEIEQLKELHEMASQDVLNGIDIINRKDAEIELAEKEIKKLTDALRSLYDQQNGPPLIRDEKHWQEAMDNAAKCLGAKGDEEEESRV